MTMDESTKAVTTSIVIKNPTANIVLSHPVSKSTSQDISSKRWEASSSTNSPTTKRTILKNISNSEEVGSSANPSTMRTVTLLQAVSNAGHGDTGHSASPVHHPTTRINVQNISSNKDEGQPSNSPPSMIRDLLESDMRRPRTHGVYTPRRHLSNWREEEDDLLRQAVAQHNARNWKLIAAHLPNRTDVQCLHRWQKVLNPVLVKGYWTKEEDERMIELVNMFGTKRWAAIARSLPGRNGKQCRERWCNHLDPNIKKGPWTEVEDLMLFLAHERFGNRWAEISKLLPGRSDNAVKNRWNTSVKKKAKDLQHYCTLWSMQNASPQDPPPVINRPKEEEMSVDEYADEYPDENLLLSDVNDHDNSTFDLFEIDMSEFSPPSTE